jgi:cholesterol transport system auxiliary component
MNRILPAALALAAIALATACSGSFLPGQAPPPKLFDLTPKSTFDADLPQANWQLLVEAPIAAAGINTSRIALKRSPTTLDYFAGAEWTDRAPALVQTLMIESFENTGKIISVGRETVALRSDYSLKLELREFQTEYYDGEEVPPTINVRINAKLVQMPDRIIMASETYGFEIESQSNTLEDIVLAFNEALGKVLKRVVGWTLREATKVEKKNKR